jgi:hypothetical protein
MEDGEIHTYGFTDELFADKERAIFSDFIMPSALD